MRGGFRPAFLFKKGKNVLNKAWLSFPLIFLLTSCLSLGTASQNNTGASMSGGDQSPPSSQQVVFTMQEQSDAGHWVSGPSNGRFIIIGVSGRLSKQEDEIEAAKQDAARKAAMYHGIQGSVEYSNTTGSGGFFDYSADSRLELNYDNNFENYVSRLTFDPEKDVIRSTGATYVRFSYTSASSNINYSPKININRPSWVNNRNMPEFDGYVTVVGFAGRRSRLRDTISASYDSAAARLIESASTKVITQDQSTTTTGTTASSTTMIRSEGRLTNFQVLEFWIDPITGGISTLAIANIFK